MRRCRLMMIAFAAGASWVGSAQAQHATVGAGLQTGNSNYFEQVGVNFGIQSGNFFFQQNSAGLAMPQFGGATANAGLTTGFALPIRGGEAYFGITASQGSRESQVSQSPSTTLTNGVPAAFFDTTQTPFVTSLGPVPVVTPALERWQQLQQGARAGSVSPRTAAARAGGAQPQGEPARSAAQERTQPAAGGALMSVAELRAWHGNRDAQAEQRARAEVEALVARGEKAEQAGKLSVAKLYYEQAARRSVGTARGELSARVRLLSATADRVQPVGTAAARP